MKPTQALLGLGYFGSWKWYSGSVINPVVATMFKKDKTKWLNILHAGWPGGLVLGGILAILLGAQAADWQTLSDLIANSNHHLLGHAHQG